MASDSHPSVSKADVIARYAEASRSPVENEKMMSSAQTWENRFVEAAKLAPWHRVRSWLDIGCGTGRFFEKVLASNPSGLQYMVGLDVVEDTIAFARSKPWPANGTVRFDVMDIEDMDTKITETFDLVTAIGVVYQCGVNPQTVIAAAARRVVPGGTLIVTTENPEFERFVHDPHGWYLGIEELEYLFAALSDRHAIFLVNPLWHEKTLEKNQNRSCFKEIFCKCDM